MLHNSVQNTCNRSRSTDVGVVYCEGWPVTLSAIDPGKGRTAHSNIADSYHWARTTVSHTMTALATWLEYVNVNTSTMLIFMFVFLCGLWLQTTPDGSAKWPPGPKTWPLIGIVIGNADIFWKNDQMYLTFAELAKTYGEILHLRVGPRRHMVVLTGQDVIREAFVDKGEYFAGRPTFSPLAKYTSNGKGKLLFILLR